MTIWQAQATPADLQAFCENTLVAHLGIQIMEIGEDYLRASMPVDHRTHQPYGLLHGGASIALAETIGSMAAHLAAAPGSKVVGLEINANHLRSVRTGVVVGTGRPLHIGRSTQVWDIRIVDADERPVCVSRLTLAVLAPKIT
ncbi:MAG: hotdog fold thioesterase [Desulfosarcinaceae bacterium]|nr:hotdog fold thioesterase [Desulfosarcinaceae bacterium]